VSSLAFWCVVAVFGAEPVFEQELVFPVEPMHNHSSSIVEAPNGDLLVAWFHGRGEKSDDTLVIRGARKRKGADSWSDAFLLADNQDLPDQNPVLFIDPAGVLWLWWISSLDNGRDTYMLKYRRSTDYLGEGAPRWAWQDVMICRPRNLEATYLAMAPGIAAYYGDRFTAERDHDERLAYAVERAQVKVGRRLGWMPRCQPIMLSDTRMMLGLYSDIFKTSLAAFTEDGGVTWEYSEIMPGYGGIQPSFVQRRNGDIVAMMRDYSPSKRIRRSVSKDGGLTWSAVGEMSIPNPGSSVSAVPLDTGHWVLACNDNEGGERGGRSHLTVYLSEDEGETWAWRRALEDHERDPAAAYPSVIQTRDGLIHCTYTYSPEPNESIKHVTFDEAWIRAGASR
jgi:predicted neuraminidase